VFRSLLDRVIDLLPSPSDVGDVEGHHYHTDDHVVQKSQTDEEKFTALAFKIMTDPFVGKLTFFRVYSGKAEAGSYVYNSISHKKERFSRLLQMHANSREDIKEVYCGDIAAAVGLKNTRDRRYIM
jgi:elongation factor G